MKDDRLRSIPPLHKSIKQRIAAICYVIVFGFFAFFGLICLGAGEFGVGIPFLCIASIMLAVEFLWVKRRWERALNYLLHTKLSDLNIPPSNSEKTQSNARGQESGQLLLAFRWRDVLKFWSGAVIVLLIVNAITLAVLLYVTTLPIW